MKTFFYMCLIAGAIVLPASERMRNACFDLARAMLSGAEQAIFQDNMAEVKMVDGDNFDKAVNSPGKVVIVDIHNEQITVQRSEKAELDRSITKLPSNVLVAKVLAERNVELMDRLQIHKVPTMRVYRDGEILEEFKGKIDRERFLEVVQYHIDNPDSTPHRAGYIGPIGKGWLPPGVEQRPADFDMTPLEHYTDSE